MQCHVIASRAQTHQGVLMKSTEAREALEVEKSLCRLHQIHFPKICLSRLHQIGQQLALGQHGLFSSSTPLDVQGSGSGLFLQDSPFARSVATSRHCRPSSLTLRAASACASSRHPVPALLLQRAAEVLARIVALVAELLLDAHQLVVLARALAWLYM